MSINSFSQIPISDPQAKIVNLRFAEDYENIRFNLLGTGGLFTDTSFSYYLGNGMEWRRPKEIHRRPVFIRDLPSRFDAIQGDEGNCWLVSAIAAITLNPVLIKHVVPRNQSFEQNYIGAFHFRIWRLGVWYDVVVDDRLPVYKITQRLCYVRSKSGDVFWAALLEKAYAKINASNPASVTYRGLGAGIPLTSLIELTGGIVEAIPIKDLPQGSSLKSFLYHVYKNNALMLLVRFKRDGQPFEGIVPKHSYIITKVFKGDEEEKDNSWYHKLFLLRIMNPWGRKEWEGDWSDEDYDNWNRYFGLRKRLDLVIKDDGEFWMNEFDFLKCFDRLCICYLGPWQYVEIRGSNETPVKKGKEILTWKVSVFHGEWIKNISAGGADPHFRYMNPNYKIKLNLPDNDWNNDGLCTVVIQLVHRSKLGRKVKRDVAVYVYSLNDIKPDQPIPIDSNFFRNVNPLNMNPDFKNSLGRSFVTTMKLKPGMYLLVPCTLNGDKESQFLLRVFSESIDESYWEYNPKISKSLQKEEQSLNKFYKTLKVFYFTVAGDQNEIDSMDLQTILEEVINPKLSLSNVLTLFLEFICNLLSINPSGQLANNTKTDRIVFTKDECRSMIAMLDDDQHSGRLSFPELSLLWDKISFWTKVYEQHKDETEGYLKVSQLQDALGAIGYNITKRIVHSLSYLYADNHDHICLKDFIICGVKFETITEKFKQSHEKDSNKIIFTLQDWVKNSLIL